MPDAGRVWLVTGGSRGIGRAVVELAAGRGDTAVSLSRRTPDRTELPGVASLAADVADPASVEAAVATTIERWGRLDVVVNNAGLHRGGRIQRLDPTAWDEVLATNLSGAFTVSRAVVPHLGAGGCIVNVGAVVGLRGFPGDSPYAASKAGLVGLTLALAMELAPQGIRANVVIPGFVETEMTGGLSDRAREAILRRIPLGRPAGAEEIAAVIASVADATYMTGAVVPVDGGLMAALGSAA